MKAKNRSQRPEGSEKTGARSQESGVKGRLAGTLAPQRDGSRCFGVSVDGGDGKPEGDGEPFITKEEVARRMRKPVRTIENWMREHRIPFYRVGHSVRFRWSDVQVHFNKCYRVAPIEPEDSEH